MLCKIVSPQKDIYKLSCVPASYQELLTTIRNRCGEDKCKSVSLKYIDSENELVTLNNPEDFATAVLSCEAEQLKTLKVFVLPEGVSTPQQLESPEKSFKAPENQIGARKEKSPSQFSKAAKNAAWKSLCGECDQEINKVKFTCLQCQDYQCCQACEAKTEHKHPLLKIRLSASRNFDQELTPKKGEKRSERVFSRNSLQKASGKPLFSSKVCFDKRRELVSSVEPSQEYHVMMVVKNNGKETWPEGASLRCVNGTYINKEVKVGGLEPGCKKAVSLMLEAPVQCGKHLSQWMLSWNDEGKQRCFGQNLFLELFVEKKEGNLSSKMRFVEQGEVKRLFHQDESKDFGSNVAYNLNKEFSGEGGMKWRSLNFENNHSEQEKKGCRCEEELIKPSKQYPVILS